MTGLSLQHGLGGLGCPRVWGSEPLCGMGGTSSRAETGGQKDSCEKETRDGRCGERSQQEALLCLWQALPTCCPLLSPDPWDENLGNNPHICLMCFNPCGISGFISFFFYVSPSLPGDGEHSWSPHLAPGQHHPMEILTQVSAELSQLWLV